MAIKGITYDNQGPTAASDAVFYSALMTDGVVSGCGLSYVGTTLTVAPGYIISAGRLSALLVSEQLEIPNIDGVARVILQTDLSQEASTTAFNQLTLLVQSAASQAALPALVQEDINGGGIVYQMALCILATSTVGIEEIVDYPPAARLGLPAVSVSDADGGNTGQSMFLSGRGAITLPMPQTIKADLHAGRLVAGPELVGSAYPENPVENQLFFLLEGDG